ncbi:hypothetical protein ACSHT0_09090 [Tepidicaulis sp. LMO-SS28]|uniref:hypothetical protein n=1 Tax=Tepidicaulis sp. LMO-SS28 TaxID=3447455 RepID=UPI003EE16B10
MRFQSASLIGDDMRGRIQENYIASERQARFRPFYFGAVLLAVLVTAGALFVDYAIVTEFWTRALANEFLELPGSLATSVTFKSLQVLFATIAAHIFLEHMSGFGRGVFVRVVFLLALMMLGGVGFLLAMMSLPNGLAELGQGGAGSSVTGALSALGLETEATQQAAAASGGMDTVRGYQPFFWMASLGVIFLVVTGVAAMCLHFALNNLRKLFLARDFTQRARDMARLAELEETHARDRERLAEMEGAENRRHALWAGLMRDCQAYEKGLAEARRRSPKADYTRPALPSPRWALRRPRPEPPREARDPHKEALEAHTVKRYEELFNQWWDKYSRHAMRAGPADREGVRAPFSEVLPPVTATARLRRDVLISTPRTRAAE